jgi:adenylate cyclase
MHTIPGAFQKLQALYADGVAAIEASRFEDAIALFTEGLAIDDHFRHQYVTQYAQRAFALQNLRRFREAAADYGKAIALEPEINQAQYHFQRGMCWAALEGEEEKALADFGRAIELMPEHPGPYHLRGKLLIDKLMRYEEGLKDVDHLLALRDIPDGHMLRAQANLNLSRYDEAERDSAHAEKLAPNPYNHYVIAICAGVRGDGAAVKTHLELLLGGRPDFKEYVQQAEELAKFRGEAWFQSLTST